VPKLKTPINNGVIATVLASLAAIILAVTTPAIGVTWDEPVYIASSEVYMGWFRALFTDPQNAFTPASIDKYWSVNHEHPPLDRTWSGIVWSASRYIVNDLTAHRLGNILLVAAMVGLLYLLVANGFGKGAGLFAAAALMLMPRFFFHAHLAALDVPVTVGIFIVTYLFWRTINKREWWWGLVLGIAWGLAESIKLNATFLPIVLIAWTLIFRRKWTMLLRLILMGIGALTTFVVAWPWLYHDTWNRLLGYINFHLRHYDIGIWYLGHYYVKPPMPYPFVILWSVVPLAVMLLVFTGVARVMIHKQHRDLGWLLVISALVPLLVISVGRTLAYDGERLFMPTFPFIAGLAGAGFGWALGGLQRITERISRPALFLPASIGLASVLLLPQTITAAGLYPHLLSYYSEGIGGLQGATKLKLETTYWCEAYAAAFPYINSQAKPGDRIWVEPWSYDVMYYYQLHGWLRTDVKIINSAQGGRSVFGPNYPRPIYGDYSTADWIIIEYRQTQFSQMGGSVPYLLGYVMKLAPPVVEVSYQGVPIMQLYKQEK
jgi:4-amino-4-deoxy-L-arabinose transferase-like glycosyltransferase